MDIKQNYNRKDDESTHLIKISSSHKKAMEREYKNNVIQNKYNIYIYIYIYKRMRSEHILSKKFF